MSFAQEFKYSWKTKNNFNILIYLNLIVFIGIKLIELIYFIIGENPIKIINWFAVGFSNIMLIYDHYYS